MRERSPSNIYETERAVSEYLLFHYGSPEEILPAWQGVVPPPDVLAFPVRCVTETFSAGRGGRRALDVGCAVGRSSFELARRFSEVVGIDYSQAFIDVARHLAAGETVSYSRIDQGELSTSLRAKAPADVEGARIRFQQGDAMRLDVTELGQFDAVLMANLIDRLSSPLPALEAVKDLVRQGGELVITSPYTWLEEFTPRENWLGARSGEQGTRPALERLLAPEFRLVRAANLPFLLREHSRKYQWSIAEATVWERVGISEVA
ncbi:MAG: putative 4-mercaptohistidine N1-methyltransferase [Verrucomicrobiia bacterium]